MSPVVFAQSQQTPATSSQTPPKVEKQVIPLKVQVTLSRYDGEKKISSLPFTLWVDANDGSVTSLNLASSVPVTDTAGNIQGRNLGTQMTCSATSLDESRFKLSITISDSSLTPGRDKTDRAGSMPIQQSIQLNNYLIVREGQVAQVVAATDKVTGEVTKIDITVSVLK
jgi:hypothetical protein